MQWLIEIDTRLYWFVNSYAGRVAALDWLVNNADVIAELLLVWTFGLLWFARCKRQGTRREILLIGGMATPLALVCNRTVSLLVPFRARPAYTIGSHVPVGAWEGNLEDWSAFPSDHGTLYFAIAYCFWLASRRWGALYAAFGLFGCVARVLMGVHYPMDLVVGALIGIVVAAAVNRPLVRKEVAGRLLAIGERYPGYFYGALLIALNETANGYHNARRIAVIIVHAIRVNG